MLLIDEKKHYQMFIPAFLLNDIGLTHKIQSIRR